jgi:hypothetical protein
MDVWYDKVQKEINLMFVDHSINYTKITNMI